MTSAQNEEVPGGRLPVVEGQGLPSARALADAVSLLNDLTFVVECSIRLAEIEALPEDARDPVVAHALWAAELVAYARCFGKGVRLGLSPADVKALPLEGEVWEVHRYLMNMRDKRIAHSVNPFEVVWVGIVAPPRDHDPSERGIALLSAVHVGDEVMARQLGAIAAHLLVGVRERVEKLQQAALGEAQALSVADVSKLRVLRSYVPTNEAAGSRRPDAPVWPDDHEPPE